MRSIDIFTFYQLGQQLRDIANLPEPSTLNSVFIPIFTCQNLIGNLLSGQIIDLGVARGPAEEVANAINNIESRHFKDANGEFAFPKDADNKFLEHWMLNILKKSIEKFEHVLATESKTKATYYATKIGIFDTEDLVERASNAFFESIRLHIPLQALAEYVSAGRALAFDLPTASAFHVGRAVEIVLKEYRDFFVPTNSGRTMGAMINALRVYAKIGHTKSPDERIIRQLDQVRDMDRNRIMHPVDTLDSASSLVYFMNGISAISAMVTDLIRLKASQSLVPLQSVPNSQASTI